jgi:hypothetical protein
LYFAPEVASEISTGALHDTPPSAELRYQIFQRSAGRRSANQSRTSPSPVASAAGAAAIRPTVETTVEFDHLPPPSVD